MNDVMTIRRYDIDWLRVLAFGLLIFYHIGMFYVDEWQWHVKSAYLSDPLQAIMLWSSQWRMSLIFFLSGIALSLTEPKVSSARLLKIRGLRILVPLIFGMLIIVPPQLYFELKQFFGYRGGYAEFYTFYVNPSTERFPEKQFGFIGLLTWNHLWYLPYLLTYTLIYLLLKPGFKAAGRWLAGRRESVAWWFIVPVLLLTLYGLILKPYFPKTNNLVFDWYNHAVYFTVFLSGYFIARSEVAWADVVRFRKIWLGIGVFAYIFVLAFVDDWFDFPYDTFWQKLPIQILVYVNAWSWILTMLGFAGAYLNKPSKRLAQLNEAVLPAYILHQTLIIVIGVGLSTLSLGGVAESLLLVLGTFLSIALLYSVIKRFAVLRVLFGMKIE